MPNPQPAPTTSLKFSSCDCERQEFRFDVFARQNIAYLERDEAVATGLNIIAAVALFSGLSVAERERLDQSGSRAA
jgi:hypothetical protein